MKKVNKMLLLGVMAMLCMVFNVTHCISQQSLPVAWVVDGTKEILFNSTGMMIIRCNDPFNVPCYTCTQVPIPPMNNVYHDIGKFYHNSNNPEIGEGYTHIDVTVNTPQGSGVYQETITMILPNNQIINNYTLWLTAVGFARP